MTALTGLLTRHQRLYVQRVSPIIINESSDPDSASDGESYKDSITFDAFQRSLKIMV